MTGLRSRYWIYTLHDGLGFEPTGVQEKYFNYHIVQKERCPTTGRLHWQGYIELKQVQRLSYLQKLIPHGHYEVRRGTRCEAREYCRKEESRVDGPFEYGVWVEGDRGRRSDLASVMAAISDERREVQLAEEFPEVWCKYYKAFERYRSLLAQESTREFRAVTVLVYLGGTGTGKTRLATSGSDWFICDDTRWFDMYQGESTLILDDFDGKNCPFRWLLRILDGYTLRLPVKGGFTWARWVKVIITSNVDIENWYLFEDISPLKRRINQIVRF